MYIQSKAPGIIGFWLTYLLFFIPRENFVFEKKFFKRIT